MLLKTAVYKPLSEVTPVAQTERLVILDSFRGIAILGILLMNIGGFGLPVVTIWDLSVLNEMAGQNLNAWLFMEGTFEGSQLAFYSLCYLVEACFSLLAGRKKEYWFTTRRIVFPTTSMVFIFCID